MSLILVLEDDPASQGVFRAALARNGFGVVLATDAAQAFEAFHRFEAEIDLLIIDLVLPQCSGAEFAVQIRKSYPHVPILFSSGTPIDFWCESDARLIAALPAGSYSFLPKPFTYGALMRQVHESLAGGLARTA